MSVVAHSGIVGLGAEDDDVGLRVEQALDLVEMEGLWPGVMFSLRPADAQAVGPDGVDVVRPGVNECNVPARFSHEAANIAAHGPSAHEDQSRAHSPPNERPAPGDSGVRTRTAGLPR